MSYENNKECPNCGQSIIKSNKIQSIETGLSYCSEGCANKHVNETYWEKESHKIKPILKCDFCDEPVRSNSLEDITRHTVLATDFNFCLKHFSELLNHIGGWWDKNHFKKKKQPLIDEVDEN